MREYIESMKYWTITLHKCLWDMGVTLSIFININILSLLPYIIENARYVLMECIRFTEERTKIEALLTDELTS